MGEFRSTETLLRHRVLKRGDADVSTRGQGVHGDAISAAAEARWGDRGLRGVRQHRPSAVMLPLPQMRKPRLGCGTRPVHVHQPTHGRPREAVQARAGSCPRSLSPLGPWTQSLHTRLPLMSLYLGYASARAWRGRWAWEPGDHVRGRAASSRGAVSALRSHLLEDK